MAAVDQFCFNGKVVAGDPRDRHGRSAIAPFMVIRVERDRSRMLIHGVFSVNGRDFLSF